MEAEEQSDVVTLEGEIDLASIPEAEARIAAAEQNGWGTLVIDLRKVTFMDSSGLRLLLAAHRRAEESGRGFALVRGSDAVDRLLKVTGLSSRLRLLDDLPRSAPGEAPSD
jgi:anti-sigma B factor antagonist